MIFFVKQFSYIYSNFGRDNSNKISINTMVFRQNWAILEFLVFYIPVFCLRAEQNICFQKELRLQKVIPLSFRRHDRISPNLYSTVTAVKLVFHTYSFLKKEN